MKYYIGHYHLKEPPVPEAELVERQKAENEANLYEVEIGDIHAFAEKHGSIILVPPSRAPMVGDWFIWVSDGRFSQR